MRFFYSLSMLLFLFLAILHFAGCGGVEVTDVPGDCWIDRNISGSRTGTTDAGIPFSCVEVVHAFEDGGVSDGAESGPGVDWYEFCCASKPAPCTPGELVGSPEAWCRP